MFETSFQVQIHRLLRDHVRRERGHHRAVVLPGRESRLVPFTSFSGNTLSVRFRDSHHGGVLPLLSPERDAPDLQPDRQVLLGNALKDCSSSLCMSVCLSVCLPASRNFPLSICLPNMQRWMS